MIVLHHLAYSRSTRVLCALEELGVDYELKSYERTQAFKAPAELADIHPLGKSPVIEDDGLVVAESSVILEYLNARYGDGRLAPPADTRERIAHDEWLQFVESTAGFSIMMTAIAASRGGLPEALEGWAAPVRRKMLETIAGGVGDGPFLFGDAFTLADIQMSYILAMAGHAGLLEDHPEVRAYLERIVHHPSFARALDIGGPMTPPKS
ncbi:glutathione S-transferase family protein [Pararhizobium mangrovi]|uniref:Glutathione S-transferase family protein n=1 Tax=Pararhizobium mangrovi TaxID=2590452 RepID=A0A506U4K8_9HYPH|nr:glutathione S-transferase family protein [Pararhizobium mangrovi]TPW29292.1 glutathione S-transferase family protein [Pararhizobium mangrovi]